MRLNNASFHYLQKLTNYDFGQYYFQKSHHSNLYSDMLIY